MHPGEETTISYRAINNSGVPVTGTATYNVTPDKAGLYFDKIQCFCFTKQYLKAGESADLAVTFFVDPDIATDPGTRDVDTITLSYTMFRSKTQDAADGGQRRAHAARDHRCRIHDAVEYPAISPQPFLARKTHEHEPRRPQAPLPPRRSQPMAADRRGLRRPARGSRASPTCTGGFTPWLVALAAACVITMMAFWWRDVIREAVYEGHHTPVVQIGLRYGMALFIASEVMFFAAFFWAFFNASLFPTEAIGGVWPPKSIHPFDPFEVPFLNTLILLTLGHHRDLGASLPAGERSARGW